MLSYAEGYGVSHIVRLMYGELTIKNNKMNKGQFNKITEWQNKTFGKATANSKMAHLAEEIIELNDALNSNKPPTEKAREKWLEFADCFILLFGAAASDGMCYEDIVDCIDEKMEINMKRKWGKPQANGVVNHIK